MVAMTCMSAWCHWRLSVSLTCATCSSSSGLPFTLRRISLISCWYSFLRCSSCLLHRRQRNGPSLSALQRLGSRCRPDVCQLPEFSEFALAGLGESYVGVVGLGTFRHHPLQLLLPLPLSLLPALLLLLGLLPPLQHLSTQGDSPVTCAERFGLVRA